MYSFHRITVNKKLHPLPSVHLVSMKDSDDTAKKNIFQAFFTAKIIWHRFDIKTVCKVYQNVWNGSKLSDFSITSKGSVNINNGLFFYRKGRQTMNKKLHQKRPKA